MYLKHFSNLDNNIITQYDLQHVNDLNYRPIHTSTSNVALTKNIYGFNNQIEGQLNYLETKTDDVLNKIIDSKYIDDEDFNTLITFISSLHERTIKTNQMMVDLFKERNEYFRSIDFDSLVTSTTSLNKVTPLSLNVAYSNVDMIKQLKPIWINNYTDIPFITSDSPIIIYNHIIESSIYNAKYGIGNQGVQIFFPICPTLCLCLYDSSAYKCNYKEYNVKKHHFINDINALILFNAYRFIYSIDSLPYNYISKLLNNYNTIQKKQQLIPKKEMNGIFIANSFFSKIGTGTNIDIYDDGSRKLIQMKTRKVNITINIPFCKDIIKFDGQCHSYYML